LKATPENIDETIQFIVDELGTIMQVDRAYIFGFDHNAHTMSNTFEWCQPGVTPMINQLQNLEFSKYFWWMKRLNNHLEIVLHCIDELPPEAASEKENLISQGIKSLLAVPLIYEGRAMGFIGFDMVLHETHWEQKSINLLHYVSAIIMNTMQRFVHHLNGKANLQAR
jgi:GAF domain-containing protein